VAEEIAKALKRFLSEPGLSLLFLADLQLSNGTGPAFAPPLTL